MARIPTNRNRNPIKTAQDVYGKAIRLGIRLKARDAKVPKSVVKDVIRGVEDIGPIKRQDGTTVPGQVLAALEVLQLGTEAFAQKAGVDFEPLIAALGDYEEAAQRVAKFVEA